MNLSRVWFFAGLVSGAMFALVFGLIYFSNLAASAPPPKPPLHQPTPPSRAWPERLIGAKSLPLGEGQTVRLAEKGTGQALVQFTSVREHAWDYRWRYFPAAPQNDRREFRGGGSFDGDEAVGVIRAYSIELDWSRSGAGKVWIYLPAHLELELLDGDAFETLDLRAPVVARPSLPGRPRIIDSDTLTPATP